jgi:hypothetical protein
VPKRVKDVPRARGRSTIACVILLILPSPEWFCKTSIDYLIAIHQGAFAREHFLEKDGKFHGIEIS